MCTSSASHCGTDSLAEDNIKILYEHLYSLYFLKCCARKTVKMAREIKQFFILDLDDVTGWNRCASRHTIVRRVCAPEYLAVFPVV